MTAGAPHRHARHQAGPSALRLRVRVSLAVNFPDDQERMIMSRPDRLGLGAAR